MHTIKNVSGLLCSGFYLTSIPKGLCVGVGPLAQKFPKLSWGQEQGH